jgi:mannitol/fructose-specific phosphotransferase system IIA component (Ntr-type)
MEFDIDKANCLFNLEAEDSFTVITRMVEQIIRNGSIKDQSGILNAVLEREKIRGTGLARGIACPHAKIAGLNRTVVAVARLKNPVDFQATDGVASRHVFMILTDAYDVSVHLKILSSIVQCYQSPEVIRRLDDSADIHQYYQLLCSCHEK